MKKMSYTIAESGGIQDALNKLSAIYFLGRQHLSCDLSGRKKYSRGKNMYTGSESVTSLLCLRKGVVGTQ